MAINSPAKPLSTIKVEGVDVDLLSRQRTQLYRLKFNTDLLQSECIDALVGVIAMIDVMLEQANVEPALVKPAWKKTNKDDINRIRDCHMAGKSPEAISKQFGYKLLAVCRLLQGKTYADHKYEPTEFAPDWTKAARQRAVAKYPWFDRAYEEANAQLTTAADKEASK